MKLKGSCHCQAVTFRFDAIHPYPFNRCYCSICRKTAGGGGYAINIKGDYGSLKVKGARHCRIYHARLKNPEDKRSRRSKACRCFCGQCGSALWLWDPEWPGMFHPFASAMDSDLPVPPEHTHLMLEFKANWVEVSRRKGDQFFERYPKESIAEWHRKHGLEVK